ncbi:LLM class F420-dependent oxidoreductase [Ktedonobacter sp. SOSP1-52]|uniref:LLM class flavin-dependent oxidoreductase n=1 Tax=Ktedonobacter sp. SOSP1-52 TaxID=2778366 RepID=UPI00191675B2|nr:LLM class flavin-dependent oxidoreductase [Ktedonobacter sp. SOSP1-52]GHO64219.1 LLM class F420-dependent oxidoreductase [Ktedonobacter sp. SOSP1-52]
MEQRAEVCSLRERVGMSVEAADPTTFVATLVEIERAGVDHVWVTGPPWNLDRLTTLAAATMRTTHLGLGTAIVPIISRHPVLMAQQALSLNALAKGRLRLGIGTSWPEWGKSVYGVEMERPLAYLREYVQVLRPLLQQGRVHHQGHYFTTDVLLQASSQIPLFLSALGPGAFRLAGEVADGVLPYMCPIPYLLNTALPALRAGAATAGQRCPLAVAHVPVVFTKDRATALQVGQQAIRLYTTLPFYRNMFVAAGFSQQEIETVSDRLVESLFVFGDESTIRARLLELLRMGFDELMISLAPVSDAVQEEIRLARLIGQL